MSRPRAAAAPARLASPAARRAAHEPRHAHVTLSAVLMICGATLCFATLDGIVKSLSQRYPVALLVWARWGMGALLLMLVFGPGMRLRMLATPRPRTQLMRGGLLCASSVCFMTGLRYLPLADATALNFSTPVLVGVMAPAFLGERMNVARAAFVAAGVIGMLMIVRPGSEVMSGGAIFAICAAGFYATYLILTRIVATEDWRVTLFFPTFVTAAGMSVVIPFAGVDIAFAWPDALLLVVGSSIGTLGHLMFLRAFQRGAASALTPFTYMQLVWATLVGWVAFATFPDGWTIAGMAVIAGSGLLMTYHEWRRGRARAEPSATGPATIE